MGVDYTGVGVDSGRMDLERVDVVLVRPSRAGNVAAACRALKNMGLRSLVLVSAGDAEPDREARALAYGAWDVLDGARRTPSLAEAVAGATLVVATSGRDVAGAWSPRRLAREAAVRACGGRLALVFGPEASGLRRDELDLCHEVVRIPTDPAHPSLNLAQAVLLLAYELRLSAAPATLASAGGPIPEEDARHPTTAGPLERAVQELRQALVEIGYLNPANPDRVLSELRRLIARAAPTAREVVLLRGLARQVAWAGRVARGRAANG
jgi:TrmH family RNA methyltransferase